MKRLVSVNAIFALIGCMQAPDPLVATHTPGTFTSGRPYVPDVPATRSPMLLTSMPQPGNAVLVSEGMPASSESVPNSERVPVADRVEAPVSEKAAVTDGVKEPPSERVPVADRVETPVSEKALGFDEAHVQAVKHASIAIPPSISEYAREGGLGSGR